MNGKVAADLIVRDLMNCSSKYSVIYTDPPWPQQKSNNRKCRPNQSKMLDYPTMSLSEIEELHSKFLGLCTEEKHNVFMWCIDKYLYESESMMKRIGYCRHARFIWNKGNGIAPAFTVRFSHEYLLWFYRPGSILLPIKEQQGKFTTIISEPSTVHSRKPIAAYTMLEDMFPGKRKIELFARAERVGWDSFGNELG